jgi:hypothetical protein
MAIYINQGGEAPFANAGGIADQHCRQNRDFEPLNLMLPRLRRRFCQVIPKRGKEVRSRSRSASRNSQLACDHSSVHGHEMASKPFWPRGLMLGAGFPVLRILARIKATPFPISLHLPYTHCNPAAPAP